MDELIKKLKAACFRLEGERVIRMDAAERVIRSHQPIPTSADCPQDNIARLNLIAAVNGLIGYTSSLEPGMTITKEYLQRLGNHYVPKVEATVAAWNTSPKAVLDKQLPAEQMHCLECGSAFEVTKDTGFYCGTCLKKGLSTKQPDITSPKGQAVEQPDEKMLLDEIESRIMEGLELREPEEGQPWIDGTRKAAELVLASLLRDGFLKHPSASPVAPKGQEDENAFTAVFNAISRLCSSVERDSSLGSLLFSQRKELAEAAIAAMPNERSASPAASTPLGEERSGEWLYVQGQLIEQDGIKRSFIQLTPTPETNLDAKCLGRIRLHSLALADEEAAGIPYGK